MSSEQNRKYLVFVGIGFELLGLMLVALYLGREVDKSYALNGLATAGFSLLALVIWFWHLIVLTKGIGKADTK